MSEEVKKITEKEFETVKNSFKDELKSRGLV